MPETESKVKYGLKNVYYAVQTLTAGVATYATPVAIPGAVNLALDPQGDESVYYADNMEYFTSIMNRGYSGSLEIALVPISFQKDILLESEDSTTKVLTERATVEPVAFALLFEFDGDASKTRHVIYNCKAKRPSVSSKTTTTSKDVSGETLSLTTKPLPSGIVKSRTTAETPTATYNGWFSTVWQPGA